MITQVIHQNSGRLLTLAPRKTMAGVPSTDDVRRRQEGRRELGRAGFLLLLLRGTRREEERERERRDERRGHEMVVKSWKATAEFTPRPTRVAGSAIVIAMTHT